MAGGLVALLDDVAMIAKLTSATSTKTMAVVINDAAVTPHYITGPSPARELPIIWRIAKESLRDKAIILVVALALSQFIPWILTPVLILGGTYLCFEGAEKVQEAVPGHHGEEEPAANRGEKDKNTLVGGAVTIDFILSTEVTVISLSSLTEEGFWRRAIALTLVGILITALVHGVVALIVKMDDVDLRLEEGKGTGRALGGLLVAAMPRLLAVLSVIGIAAMLWVDGHILLDSAAKLGWGAPLGLVHGLTHATASVPVADEALEWVVETACSAMPGLTVGAVIVAVVHLIPKRATKPARQAQAIGEDFGEQAATWDNGLERITRVRRVATVVCPVVPPDGHPITIELGSGTGMLAHRLHDVLEPTTLLDASLTMVGVASKALTSEGLGDQDAAVADLSEGIPGGPYKLALAQMFLHHVDDVPALLRTLRRVITPGGVAVIADLDHDAAKRYRATAVDFHGYHGFCRDELCGQLEQAGYRDIYFRDTEVVDEEIDGERQGFPVFLAVARV